MTGDQLTLDLIFTLTSEDEEQDFGAWVRSLPPTPWWTPDEEEATDG